MRKTRELIYDLLLVITDFTAVVSAYVAAYGVRAKLYTKPLAFPYGFRNYLEVILLFTPVWIIIFAFSGLYRNSSSRSRLEAFGQVFLAAASGSMLLILIDFYLDSALFPSKAISLYGFGFSFVLVLIGRYLLRNLRDSLARRGIGTQRVVLVGGNQSTTARILQVLEREGAQVVAVVASRRWLKSGRYFSNMASFIKALSGLNLDQVIQMDAEINPREHLELVKSCHAHHVRFRLVPSVVGLATAHRELTTLDGVPVIEIKPTSLDGWGRIIKRIFDFSVALIALILLAPALVLIGLLIKLTDPGPVFYRQKRLSRDWRPVSLIKFRTMKAEYSGQPVEKAFTALGREDLVAEFRKENKLTDDPRVSAIGRILRSSSLDELPQLFNVLMGSLSLVGPRPMLPEEVERFGQDNIMSILSLKSGLTGLWQVSGRSDIGFEGRVRLDLYYVENWSILLDIRILLRTILVILRHQGAY